MYREKSVKGQGKESREAGGLGLGRGWRGREARRDSTFVAGGGGELNKDT